MSLYVDVGIAVEKAVVVLLPAKPDPDANYGESSNYSGLKILKDLVAQGWRRNSCSAPNGVWSCHLAFISLSIIIRLLGHSTDWRAWSHRSRKAERGSAR